VMRILDFFKLAFKALMDRKVRSVLTILGIAVGSAIILALVASSTGLTAGISAQIGKTGANVLTVMRAGGFFERGGEATSSFQLSQNDVNFLLTIHGVTAVYPYYQYGATMNVGGSSLRATLVGIDLNSLFVLYKGLTIAAGFLPNAGETTSAVVGWSIANPTSGTPLQVTQMVSMTVSGIKGVTNYAVLAGAILSQYGSALFSNVDDSIFISLQAMQFLAKTSYFTGIYVVTATPDDVADVQSAIQTYYSTNVRVMSPGQILSSIQSITGQLSLFLGSIGGVSLFVATVGIVNTMYVSVMERTREIGIMKALGFKPRQIMSIFLAEAALTGMIGTFFGFMLGYVLSFLMGGMFSSFGGGGMPGFGGARGSQTTTTTIQPVFSSELIIFSLVFPVILATLAGLYPAWRASKMNAVKALKYE